MINDLVTVQKYTPSILHPYIECFSIYYFPKGEDIQLFPKGVFEIVFQSNDCFEHNTSYSAGWQARPKSFIGGLHNRSYFIKPQGRENYCIVVEFKPHTAKYFVPVKLNDFQNQVVSIFDIWGPSAVDLAQRIHRERSDVQKVEFIEAFLFDKFIQQKQSVIDQSIQCIQNSRGFVEVKELSNQSKLSTAQFRKRFKEEIGISPSQYCKIVRINTTLDILKDNYQASLTELTYQLGYFDQAHFIKDFKSIVGATPKQFKRAI